MKKLLFFVCVLISLLIINNLTRSIYSLWQKQDLISQSQKELTREKAKHTTLQAQLRQVEQPNFIEQEARNKLFLVQPGEQLVLVPDGEEKTVLSEAVKKQAQKPNWEQWWELFAGSNK